jgi:hypothetical protein
VPGQDHHQHQPRQAPPLPQRINAVEPEPYPFPLLWSRHLHPVRAPEEEHKQTHRHEIAIGVQLIEEAEIRSGRQLGFIGLLQEHQGQQGGRGDGQADLTKRALQAGSQQHDDHHDQRRQDPLHEGRPGLGAVGHPKDQLTEGFLLTLAEDVVGVGGFLNKGTLEAITGQLAVAAHQILLTRITL